MMAMILMMLMTIAILSSLQTLCDENNIYHDIIQNVSNYNNNYNPKFVYSTSIMR